MRHFEGVFFFWCEKVGERAKRDKEFNLRHLQKKSDERAEQSEKRERAGKTQNDQFPESKKPQKHTHTKKKAYVAKKNLIILVSWKKVR